MVTATIHYAKTHLSKLIAQIEAGESEMILIKKGNKPVARLIPLDRGTRVKRKGNAWEGKVEYAPDFDEADKEIEEMFENSKIFPDEDA